MAMPAIPRRAAIFACIFALLVSAGIAVELPSETSRAPTPCIHDRIAEKKRLADEADAALGKIRTEPSAILEVPVSRATSSGYQPIRIAVYTDDLYDSSKYCAGTTGSAPSFEGGNLACSADNQLTAARRNTLIDTMIPEAIKMHEDRLNVEPLSRVTLGNSMSGTICGEFTVPASVQSNGVTDADFVLFVAGGPVDGSTVAWATTCGSLSNGRPVVGVINVKPQYMDGTDQSVRTMAHEIMHALGFNGNQFNRNQMTATISKIRGVPKCPVVDSPNVLQRAGNQFNCDELPGMELDNSGGAGTAGSHWSMRNARQDMMCGYVGPAMKYSAITLAAMEDLGYYKPNYDKAEFMDWGFNAGCGLLNRKCVIDGKSQFPSMFCDNTQGKRGPSVCGADRMGLGYCPIYQYNQNLPSYYRYFSNPTWGGADISDYCPIVSTYIDTGCMDGSQSVMPYSLIGASSRCVDAASGSALTDSICVDVQCDASAGTYSIRFLGGTQYVSCREGSTVDASDYSSSLPSRSTITCPAYGAVCPGYFNSLDVKVKQGGSTDGAAGSMTLGAAAVGSLLMAAAAVLTM